MTFYVGYPNLQRYNMTLWSKTVLGRIHTVVESGLLWETTTIVNGSLVTACKRPAPSGLLTVDMLSQEEELERVIGPHLRFQLNGCLRVA